MIQSNSPSTLQTNPLINGLIPPNSSPSPNPKPNHIRLQTNDKNRNEKRAKCQEILLKIGLTLLFSILFIVIIEFLRILVQDEHIFSANVTRSGNESKQSAREKEISFESFFASVWLFNLFLFFICLFLQLFSCRKQISERNRSKTDLIREFGRIFDSEQFSSTNTLVDYLLKTCLLCFLWYFSCYLMLRSISILISLQIIISYSITITLREVLGWIFLHELFIGNKIIGHILSLSSVLFLLHNDGFRLNKFFFTLILVTLSVAMKTTFDILLLSFIKDLSTSKIRMVMINVCLCGTCLLWPFILILHLTKIELIQHDYSHPLIFVITFVSLLLFHLLNICIPIRYTKFANILSLLFVIPSIALIDHYLFQVQYSSLIYCSIVCSFSGIVFSIIPKEIFEKSDRTKMKQMLSFHGNSLGNVGFPNSHGLINSTSSTFDQIRAERRLRNALLYNDMKS